MKCLLFCTLILAATSLPIGPCDIYDAVGTPCVGAHSTVRALYGAYNGFLYEVLRSSDGATRGVGVVDVGGYADSAAQDAFCGRCECVINRIFDQCQRANHLDIAPPGGHNHSRDMPVNASRLKLTVGGHLVYALYFEGGMGYRNDNTSGVAKDDQSESLYMVAGGTHYNDQCCFDYGNAETDDNDDGHGTMEAIYWGTWNASRSGWSGGSGRGPWVMADLEDGLWAGNQTPINERNTPVMAAYITAMLKGQAGGFALKGGNAQSGRLKNLYEGYRPTEYARMRKQGSIILGIGGDNSNRGVGTFFEGAIVAGYTSDATDDAIQANIVAAGYGRNDPPEFDARLASSLIVV
eukprot:TRINITY_DN55619_c0_g1_i1.p1 TRINITY_DN55619_c0_g1~~TRINITY_DN55619_c0_g1_i1.p1  ORF type:complete len:351 (-),score=47.47 TRINITY_DN55619_c0_g1_i1:136-1188(-)